MSSRFQGRGIVKGRQRGAVLVSRTPISFLGDLDIRTGQVTGTASDLTGRSIAGRVLVVPATRGSAGAWRFIYQLKQHNTHPLAIITDELPDPSVVQGASSISQSSLAPKRSSGGSNTRTATMIQSRISIPR